MIQNLQPLTLTPFLLAAGFKHSQPNPTGGSWPLTSALSQGESVRRLSGGFFFMLDRSPIVRPSISQPPSLSSCVKCLAVWWSLNLSGHYSPPSASTSHPSSLCALFNPAVCLASSPHNSALSQQITVFPCISVQTGLSLSLSLFVHFVGHFLLMTSFFFLFTLSSSC